MTYGGLEWHVRRIGREHRTRAERFRHRPDHLFRPGIQRIGKVRRLPCPPGRKMRPHFAAAMANKDDAFCRTAIRTGRRGFACSKLEPAAQDQSLDGQPSSEFSQMLRAVFQAVLTRSASRRRT